MSPMGRQLLPPDWGLVEGALAFVIWSAVVLGFYVPNQRLVRRKALDHRPYFVPSLWGPFGTLVIVLAAPRGWKRAPSS
jgi:hypothetical protein